MVVARVERHDVADLLGHVLEVRPVAHGQDDLFEAGPVGGEHLLLDARRSGAPDPAA